MSTRHSLIPKHIRIARWLILSFSVAGCALIWVNTSRFGVGLSADSVTYLSTADNLLAGKGFTYFSGDEMVMFPPLYPILLALAGWLQLDPLVAARVLNVVIFGALAGITTAWVAFHTRSVALTTWAGTAVLSGIALVETAVYAWTEPLFILLTMCSLGTLEKYLSTHAWRYLLVSAALAGGACLTRYAGTSLVLCGLALVALMGPSGPLLRLRALLVYAATTAFPTAIWLVHNYFRSGTLTGTRVPAQTDLLTHIKLAVDVTTQWFLPSAIPLKIRALVLIALVITAQYLLRRSLNTRHHRLPEKVLAPVLPYATFVGTYLIFLLLSVSVTALSPIDNRYMSPILLPLILVICYISYFITKYRNSFNRILLSVLFVGLLFPIFQSAQKTQWYIVEGAGGFHTRRWMHSDVMAYIKNNKLCSNVYTNEPYAVFALTGIHMAESPSRYAYASQIKTDKLAQFTVSVKNTVCTQLIMFDGTWWRDYLYSAEELAETVRLQTVASMSDGKVYLVNVASPKRPQ